MELCTPNLLVYVETVLAVPTPILVPEADTLKEGEA